MNIAKMMIPKVCTVFLRENTNLWQGMMTLLENGYNAVPVLDSNDKYVGSVSEGDFLKRLLNIGSTLKEDYQKCTVSEIMRKDFCPPLNFNTNNKAIIDAVQKQNFVPIVDDRGYLSGILTRQSVISYLSGNVI